MWQIRCEQNKLMAMKNFSCQRRLNARFYALAALTLALSGCGGGSHAPRTTPTSTGAAQIARWKPVVSGDAPAPSAPPTAGSATEQSEIAQLLALQSARAGAQITAFNAWNGHVAARFNALARALVISHDTVPPLASRVYAALGVAQFDAVIAANRQRTRFSRATPAQTDARLTPLSSQSDGYPSPESALCAASADVLKSLYPDSAAQIDKARDDCQQSRLIGGVAFPSDVEAGADIGDSIAAKILARIATDNSDQAARNLPQPSGPGYWKGTGGLLPSWKFVKPWLTTDITPFRAPAPPAFDSVAFQTDLAEVRQISDNRSATQSQIADFWADAAQTFTPPGHWNLFAEKMVESHNLSDAQSARVFALLGMASQDAGDFVLGRQIHLLGDSSVAGRPADYDAGGFAQFSVLHFGPFQFFGRGGANFGSLVSRRKING